MGVADGVYNLLRNCVQVQRGEKVLIINEQGAMDRQVADVITRGVEVAAGALPEVRWEPGPPPGGGPGGGGGDPLSDDLIAAIAAADKVIANYPLRNRELAQHLGEAPGVVVVHNAFRTQEDFASNHAGYHWGMANAIYGRFQKELFAEGRRFRLAGTGGTDLVGVIGAQAERARQIEDEHFPFARSFDSPAYIPVASTKAEGKAVIEYTGGFRRIPIDHPPTIVIEGNLIRRVEGRPEAQRWVEEYSRVLDEHAEKLARSDEANKVDSWHGGLHPTAECTPGTPGARALIGNASTDMAHFHIGPDGAHAQLQWGRTTLELDDERVLLNGSYAPGWDDLKLREAARRFGLRDWRVG